MRNKFSSIPDLKRIKTPSGSRVKEVYEARFNGSSVSIVSTGKLDTQKEIESYAPFTDLNYMLHRLSVGDRSVLASSQPLYGNFVGFPSNPVDAINMVQSAEDSFAELSPEVRQSFNNDFRVWLANLFSCSSNNADQLDPGQADNHDDPESVKE